MSRSREMRNEALATLSVSNVPPKLKRELERKAEKARPTISVSALVIHLLEQALDEKEGITIKPGKAS